MPITPAHLEGLTTFEQLAELFHHELGWPRPEWPTFRHVATLYGLDPENDIPGVVSLAAVEKLSDDQTWGIFLVDFGPNELKRSDLRRILHRVADRARQEHANPTWPHENVLFVCRSRGNRWTLGYYRGDALANAKLRTFGWDDPKEARTAVENLSKLHWQRHGDWADAWNVERLTKAFFTDYRAKFEQVEAKIAPIIADEALRRRFVQALFNRLMFLCFLQRKGWLEFEGERKRYLFALHQGFQGTSDERGFYDRLRKLFFSGLNSPNGIGGQSELVPLIGRVPFLNGGLFEPHPVLDRNENFVPDDVFPLLLGPSGLFQSYNFTVTEATPMDEDVAIDPEMLGKVFEELVTGRHETGSYYTPRPIVSFMCREALKGYLEQTEGVDPSKIIPLVDQHDATTITVAEARALIVRLKVATICDPACGSGAYLLGMLHELFTLRQILDTKDEQSSAADDYDRKVGIIRNNLYGVDLDVLAVNIAWLRVWLALIIEDERNPIDDGSDVSLPNIDAKIAQGNSLLGPGPATSQSALQDESLIDEIREKRGRYIVAHGAAKRDLAELIITAKQQLAANLGHPSARPEEAFDWVVEFPEVLLPREPVATIGGAMNLGQGELAEAPSSVGFDIILANPPYVRHELITAIKPQLRQVFGENYSGTADLYTFFYLRSIGLLKAGGMLCFISSNKWFRAAYGANLRRFIASCMDVRSITDFGELKVFETAATFPMIFIAQKGKRDGSAPTFTQVKALDPPYPDVAALIAQSGFALPPNALNGAEWRLVDAETAARMRRMEASGVPLGEYVKGKIFYGIKTGFNEAFVIDGAKRAALIAEDPKSAEIIKPLAVGDDVRKWRIRKRDVWLIFTRRGLDIDRYPAIKRHLMPWRTELEPRPRAWKPTKPGEKWPGRKPGSYKWYEIQDDIAYYAEFDKPKIVFPEIAMEQRFCYDAIGTFTNNKAFIVPLADLFLLGVLNSSLAWEFASMACAALGDEDNSGRVMLQWINFQRTPIPHASDADRVAIEALVQQILDLKAADPAFDVTALEAEIDKRVEFLYFSQHEAPTYDEWVAKREAERGTIIEEVRQLLAVGHETVNLECKSTFAWDVKKNEQGDYLKDEVHTAICALLNAQGGDLLIGVEELDGNILRVRGLAEDLRRYGGKDGLLSAIEQPLGRTLYPNPIGHVDIKAVDIDGETVVRVHVTPDHTERYRFKDQIYVRRNTKSKPPLTADEAAIWWPKRQRGEV